MDAFVCIHGHFYQPPRENPWLEAVELQDSAYPYHDWNERITAECYAPNATSRILDDKGRIREIVNNYSRISFNFGPTLLSWMERNAAGVYQAILDADRESRQRFSGHGSALAQAYNHMILPLANSRDKHTQVLWGIGISSTGSGAPRRHVAAGNRRGPGDAGRSGRARHPVHDPLAAPGQTDSTDGGEWLDVGGGRLIPLGRTWRGCRRARPLPCSFTTAPSPRRSRSRGCCPTGNASPTDSWRLLPRPQRAAAGAHRHRRGKLRAPPPRRRHGAGVCAAPSSPASWRA